jgi:hypothetical protein
MPSPQQQINAIDKQINALRREVPSRDLRHARECELFRQRGLAQLDRDEQAAKQRVKRIRAAKPKKCPTCGCHTLYARAA